LLLACNHAGPVKNTWLFLSMILTMMPSASRVRMSA